MLTMRQYLLVLTLGGFFVLNTGTASAASCSASAGSTSRYFDSGYEVMGYYANIYGCSQVEAIQWSWPYSGYFDYSSSPAGFHTAYLAGGQATATLNNPGSGNRRAWVAQTCWYGGMHVLDRLFSYRIKNSVTHTWGSWWWNPNPVDEGITC